jgi:hypothetical protein
MAKLGNAGLACMIAVLLLAVPVTALATDGHQSDNKHRILTQQLRQRLEMLKEKMRDYREHHTNNGSTDTLQAQVTDLQNKLATMAATEADLVAQLIAAQTQIGVLLMRVSALETVGGGGSSSPALSELAKHLTVDPNMINGVKGPHVILSGVNLHLRSGSGSTGDNGTPMGLGNLIIGYNEGPHPDPTSGRTGSHNLVGGTLNAFTASGGIVFGTQNWTQGGFSSILGGTGNLAQGMSSSILGGRANWTGSSDQTVP